MNNYLHVGTSLHGGVADSGETGAGRPRVIVVLRDPTWPSSFGVWLAGAASSCSLRVLLLDFTEGGYWSRSCSDAQLVGACG